MNEVISNHLKQRVSDLTTELKSNQVQLVRAADHIETLLPFARTLAKESGDIAGMVRNIEDWLRLPLVIFTRVWVDEREKRKAAP